MERAAGAPVIALTNELVLTAIRALTDWLDSPVPLDEDRRPRFLRFGEAIGRGIASVRR